MTFVKTFAEAEEAINKYIPLTKELVGADIRLDRIGALMDSLGNPQEKLKIIHVAGTSGKTSTCYYIASLLKNAGQRVGLTVSPHIDTIRERVQIDLKPVSEDEFVESLNEFLPEVEKSGVEPSYFEFLIAFAYWYFVKQKVDYAVIETGIGGRFDGTNIATNPDKVCVITDVGLDHMHVLGTNVSEIARQKAGIIHEQNQVFMLAQPLEVVEQFELRCAEVDADLTVLGEQDVDGELADYQKRNFSLASQAFDWIKDRDSLGESDMAKAKLITVPGRMDRVKLHGKEIIMDGAHNEQKMKAFVRSFQMEHPEQKAPVLLALKRGKEFAAVLPLLKPITSQLIITNFSTSQDIPLQSIDAVELAKVAKKFGFADVIAQSDKAKAYEELLGFDSSVAVMTGSFYLIGQLRDGYPELRQE